MIILLFNPPINPNLSKTQGKCNFKSVLNERFHGFGLIKIAEISVYFVRQP